MERIQKFAKFFRIIFLISFIITPVFTGVIWLSGGEINFEDDPAELMSEIYTDGLEISPEQLPPFPLPMKTRLLGLGASMLTTGTAMLALWWLFQLFGRFAQGEIFTESTVKYIRYLGWTMIAGVIALPFEEALTTLILTIHNPPGDRIIAIGFESADFEELVVGGVIILISWIMDEGRKLRETDELTV